MIMETKRPQGRPRRETPYKQIGCRIDLDLYDELKARYGEKVNMTKWINNVIRKELGL